MPMTMSRPDVICSFLRIILVSTCMLDDVFCVIISHTMHC